jgi:hypothetical protein
MTIVLFSHNKLHLDRINVPSFRLKEQITSALAIASYIGYVQKAEMHIQQQSLAALSAGCT